MLSDRLEHTLRNALSIAMKYQHEYATSEHLLLALLNDQDVTKCLENNNIKLKDLSLDINKYVNNNLTELKNSTNKHTKPTACFQRIIQRAAMQASNNYQQEINGIHILSEFFFEYDSHAFKFLKKHKISKQNIENYIDNTKNTKTKKENQQYSSLSKELEQPLNTINKASKNNYYFEQSAIIAGLKPNDTNSKLKDINIKPPIDRMDVTTEEDKISNEDIIKKYCVDLNQHAKDDGIDLLIGRTNEIQRTIEILCRRKKNNAILVGEPGVGKTAIAEGLALRITKNDVPNILQNTNIYSLDIGSLISGTKYRGDFEDRIKKLLHCFKENKQAILFIDEIHNIIGAGSTVSGALDASNLLKPALAKGELRCIGSTTFKEYHNHFEKDMALVRRFQKIVVAEPTKEETLNILRGLKGYYEKYHQVSYTDEALKSAIDLSQRYIHERHLPDKAIDLIDEAGSRSVINNHDPKKAIVTDKDIKALISSILNIPNFNILSDQSKQLKKLETNLKSVIFGQDKAIHSLVDSIKLSTAGLKNTSKPSGCYLFIGSDGVGKKALAKALANLSNMKLLKFDMNEFTESSSITKLIGSAPGYTGYDQGGILTDEIDKHPYSVLLFDDIDKAHPETLNVLYNILDEGEIKDNTGKMINFCHCIIIFTSNTDLQKNSQKIGFNGYDKDQKTNELDNIKIDSINNLLTEEFRNKLDNIILFNSIDNILEKIVTKNISELADQLADKNVRIIVANRVKKHLIKLHTTKQNNSGSTGISRLIDVQIKQKIADEILFGKIKKGGKVFIDLHKASDEIIFDFIGNNDKISNVTASGNTKDKTKTGVA